VLSALNRALTVAELLFNNLDCALFSIRQERWLTALVSCKIKRNVSRLQSPVMIESVRAAADSAVKGGRMTAEAAESLMNCYMARLGGVTYLK